MHNVLLFLIKLDENLHFVGIVDLLNEGDRN